jgi:formiminoglutamate deiminase
VLDGATATADVVLTVHDGVIREVTPGAPCPPGAVRLRGVVLPGFVNTHSHAFHRALRGRTHGGAGDFWSWRTEMYRLAARLDPDSYRALATATYAEMALAGITCVGEFHYLHHRPGGRPYDEPNAMGLALLEAADSAGLRATLLDACYLRAGLDGAPLGPQQQRFGDGDVEAWLVRVDTLAPGPLGRVGAAPHSVRAVDEASLAVVAEAARRRGWPVHVHVSEQPAENAACLAATGRTPTRVLADAGVLGPSATAVHATHLTADDVALLGGSRTHACLCPTTERDLADGVGPAAALAAVGSTLCTGSDSQAVIDPFEELRAIELDERLVTGRRGSSSPAALLGAGSAGGAAALGWGPSGLVPGAPADFVTVDVGSVRLAGFAPERAAAHLVFAATAADVTDVVVAGRRIVEGGEHLLVPDVAGALRRAIAALESP